VGGDVDAERLREMIGQPDALPGQPELAPFEFPQNQQGDSGQEHDEDATAPA
jgi:hypothetical protein